MKGATIGHAKQHFDNRRYIGLTEPGIIAAESPNPIVNELVILPDIEKRLEAFVRIAHSGIVFPGGVGTAEEILYLLGILLHPANANHPMPLIFAASEDSREYFETIDKFIGETLGPQAQSLYQIVTGDAQKVARRVAQVKRGSIQIPSPAQGCILLQLATAYRTRIAETIRGDTRKYWRSCNWLKGSNLTTWLPI